MILLQRLVYSAGMGASHTLDFLFSASNPFHCGPALPLGLLFLGRHFPAVCVQHENCNMPLSLKADLLPPRTLSFSRESTTLNFDIYMRIYLVKIPFNVHFPITS